MFLQRDIEDIFVDFFINIEFTVWLSLVLHYTVADVETIQMNDQV